MNSCQPHVIIIIIADTSYWACLCPWAKLYHQYLKFSHLHWGWVRLTKLPKVLGFEPTECLTVGPYSLYPSALLLNLNLYSLLFHLNSRLISMKFDLHFYWTPQHLRDAIAELLAHLFRFIASHPLPSSRKVPSSSPPKNALQVDTHWAPLAQTVHQLLT